MFDEDIKILGEQKSDEESFEELFLRERENGNVKKAHDLGVALAQKVIESEQKIHDFLDADNFMSYARQKRLLLAFVIHSNLNLYCKNSILTETAKADFNSVLRKNSPVTTNDMNEGTAFTLYYLAKRTHDESEVPLEIGKCFSELCGTKNSKVFINLGRELYLEFEKIAKTEVRKADFV